MPGQIGIGTGVGIRRVSRIQTPTAPIQADRIDRIQIMEITEGVVPAQGVHSALGRATSTAAPKEAESATGAQYLGSSLTAGGISS